MTALTKHYPEPVELMRLIGNNFYCRDWWLYIIQLRTLEGYAQVSFREQPCTWTFIKDGIVVTVNSLGEIEKLCPIDDSDDFVLNDNF